MDITPEDWDLMLDAITVRLRTQSTSHQSVMLECAAALEQLHGALHHERAVVRAELAEIRDGEQRAHRMARHDSLTVAVAVLFLDLDLDGFNTAPSASIAATSSSTTSTPAPEASSAPPPRAPAAGTGR